MGISNFQSIKSKMGKKPKSKGGASKDGGGWSHAEHSSRFNRKVDKQQEKEMREEDDDNETTEPTIRTKNGKRRRTILKGYHRSMHLSHDNREKRDKAKLRLHITKAERDLEKLRTR